MKQHRKPAVAGRFYPADPTALASEIDYYFSNADISATADVRGVVAPHAGYMYSGLTASYAYKHLQPGMYKTVIVLSPSHHEYFRGSCIYSGESYETPFGSIPVNKDLREAMLTSDNFIFAGTSGHGHEHAIEVHLPFLQRKLGEFSLVPIVIGDQDIVFVNALSARLKEIADPDILLVASSDLSHYYPRQIARILDGRVAEHLLNYNYEGLSADIEKHNCEACGAGAIIALMKALDINSRRSMRLLHQSDSGDASGDTNEVVGYVSAAVTLN